MERRLFLAIALSILILMAYSSLVSRLYPPKVQQVDYTKGPSQNPSLGTTPFRETKQEIDTEQKESIVVDFDTPKELLKILQNEDLSLSIDPKGTGIKECKLNSFKDVMLSQTNIGLLTEWQGIDFKENDITSGMAISYNDKDKGFEVKKEYRFTENKFIIEMTLEFISHSDTKKYVKYGLNIGSMNEDTIRKNPMDQRYIEFVISLPSKILRSNFLIFNPKTVDDKINWAGIRDRYFCVLIRPLQNVNVDGVIKSSNAGLMSYVLQTQAIELLPGQRIRQVFLVYLGPQQPEFISKLGADAENIVNFGIFDSLSHILLGALRIFYKVSKNWGVAIILFSVVVFLIMSPLSIKSFSSMKKMQELQPVIEELKIKYKGNPQKMHKEVMELYREKKINPLGGCLPLFLQMPIFIALYQTLMRFIDLKGAHFLWIKDLSEPDKLFEIAKYFPIIGRSDKTGTDFNLLPVIMIITMLVQQKLTSGVAAQQGSASAQQQKMMGLFMAVFFGIIFYHMPSALVLYWAVNSVLMLVFQIRMFSRGATQKLK